MTLPCFSGFTIGQGRFSVALKQPVILAPMSGVTDLPFRTLTRQQGAELVVSEMIASWAMVRENARTSQMAELDDGQGISAIQLAGCDPAVMAEAAKLAVDRGAHIVDLNFGCPVKKVAVGQQAGSALMRDEALAARLFQACVQAVPVPVTLKMRMGWDHQSLNAARLARIAEACGISMITVHGRTRQQFYTGTADWAFVRGVKDAVRIPVIVNGDIVSEEAAADAMRQSGADGVMIGRGCYGRPWFIRQVADYLHSGGTKTPAPAILAQRDILLGHYASMLHTFGMDAGMRLARKHVSWYSKALPGSAEFRSQVNMTTAVPEVITLINQFYDAAAARAGIQA